MRTLEMKRNKPLFMMAALALVAVAPAAMANILNAGTGATTPDQITLGAFTTVAITPYPGSPYAGILGKINGTYAEQVVSDSTNIFCAGCLDFLIQVELNAGPDDVLSLSTGSYLGFTTVDAGYLTNFCGIYVCGSTVPTSMDEVTPGVIDFTFGSGIPIGGASVELVIETNATGYTAGDINFIDDDIANVAGFAPAAVPEPTSILLFGGAVALACSAIRRKLRNA